MSQFKWVRYRGGGKPGRQCPGAGNPNGGPPRIDWLRENYCSYCEKRWFKGTFRCPDCHRRVRVCPRAMRTSIDRRSEYKTAQVEAATKLKNIGWKLPPARVSCKRWL